jgi:hypothetical protein
MDAPLPEARPQVVRAISRMLKTRLSIPAACSKASPNEAAGRAGAEAYAVRYVEAPERPRTKLETFFSMLPYTS